VNRCTLDHLVVGCADLAQGDAWLRATLGVAAQPGGRHPTMGTHNRLLRLGARSYLELLAIDPDGAAQRPRWFGLDLPAVRERLRQRPFLLGWVVATADVEAAVASVPALGAVQRFSRGDFSWRLTVPADGRPAFDGLLPAAIQWDGAHPCETLEDRGAAIDRLRLAHPASADLEAAFAALAIDVPFDLVTGAPQLAAKLRAGGREVVID
jgi:hypothetical protein